MVFQIHLSRVRSRPYPTEVNLNIHATGFRTDFPGAFMLNSVSVGAGRDLPLLKWNSTIISKVARLDFFIKEKFVLHSALPLHNLSNRLPLPSKSKKMISKFKNIAVIGAGTMGNGIAHVFAQSGYEVNLIDVSEEALKEHLKE